MKLPVSRLNHIVEFGVSELVDDGSINGTTRQFTPQLKLHCAIYQRSMSQQYQLIGTKLMNTIVIAVRSQYKVNDQLLARFEGKVYRIVTISRDQSHNLPRYDLITLQLFEKGVAKNG